MGFVNDVSGSENSTSRESEEEMLGPFRTQIQQNGCRPSSRKGCPAPASISLFLFAVL